MRVGDLVEVVGYRLVADGTQGTIERCLDRDLLIRIDERTTIVVGRDQVISLAGRPRARAA